MPPTPKPPLLLITIVPVPDVVLATLPVNVSVLLHCGAVLVLVNIVLTAPMPSLVNAVVAEAYIISPTEYAVNPVPPKLAG